MQQNVISEEQMFQLQGWINSQMREGQAIFEAERRQMEAERRQNEAERRQIGAELEQLRTQRMEMQSRTGPATKSVPKPKVYTGSRDINDIQTWCDNFEAFAEQCRLPDEKYTRIASIYLDKEARVWYRQYPNARQWSWAEFQERLINRFSNPVQDEDVLDKWDRVRQTGSVFDYSAYFEKLHGALPADVRRGHQEAPGIVLRKYIQGLKPKTRREIELKAPTTLEEATRAAYKIDGHFSRDNNPNHFRSNHTSNRSAYKPAVTKSGDQPMEIDNVQKQPHRDLSKVECHGCHELGHYKRNCPKVKHQ